MSASKAVAGRKRTRAEGLRSSRPSLAKQTRTSAKADVSGIPEPRSDWPAPGEAIDPLIQDLPHRSCDTEWWYLNGHVRCPKTGREFSVFASFFTIIKGRSEDTRELQNAYAVTWGLVDPTNKEYFSDVSLSPDSRELILKQLDAQQFNADSRICKALSEMLRKGGFPRPDRLMAKEATMSREKLELDFDGCTLQKSPSGSYLLRCAHEKHGFSLEFAPQKAYCRQAHDGIVRVGRSGDEMFYYYTPGCGVSGSLTLPEGEFAVEGKGWYDHEFGGKVTGELKAPGKTASTAEEKDRADFAWNWLSCMLDDGTDITATTVINPERPDQTVEEYAVVVDSHSNRTEYHKLVWQPHEIWRSPKTGLTYPTRWSLDFEGENASVKLTIEAEFPEQEIITLISKPAFWEGRVRVHGTVNGRKVSGLGFVERHGFENLARLDVFFKRMNRKVVEAVNTIVPRVPDQAHLRLMLEDPHSPAFADNIDLSVYSQTITGPLRDIIDRGGKSWRSYACLVCCDAVGGDSNKYVEWLAFPELMHVGSLIIDDIQDESEIRRGGETLHKMIGTPLAINTGCAAYFLGERLKFNLSQEHKVKFYELYFEALRAGHVGQGLDIYGLSYMMDDVVAKGGQAAELLLQRVICVHRLKSAAPACNVARMGAVVGGGTDIQIEKMGGYFKALGIAFQIIDDVLNLAGFVASHKEQEWKTLGEDLRAGKVTYPVAKAMIRLDQAQRSRLWEIIKSKPEEQELIGEAIALIEECGALADSKKDAHDLVEQAYVELDAVIPDSFYKLMLRAFGIFVLDRHY